MQTTRSDRRRKSRALHGRGVLAAPEASTHCACFGVLAGRPSFAVHAAVCGHWLEVTRVQVETLGGRISKQVTIPVARAVPVTGIADGLRIAATADKRIGRIHNHKRGHACRCFSKGS
jgi:hypothetical protein